MSGSALPAILTATGVLAAAAALRVAHRGTRARRLAARIDPAPVRRPGRPVLMAPAWFARRLARTPLVVPASTAWALLLAALASATVAGALLGGPGAAVLLGCGAAVGSGIALRLGGRGHDRRLAAGLPAALEAMARALRSGASPHQAVQEAAMATPGQLGADLASVVGRVEHGEPLATALEQWARWRPLHGVRLAVAALSLGITTGGASAQAVDGVAATLRDRLALEGELRALASQAKASAWLLVVAPVVFCLFTLGADPRAGTFLFRSPLGWACLAAGLGLDAAAALWMHRITSPAGGGRLP